MAYLDEYALIFTEDNDLHKKTARAIDIAARAVLDEELAVDPPPTEEEVQTHIKRQRWARWLRRDPVRAQSEAHRAMPQLLDVAAVQTAGNTIVDNTLQNIVNVGVNMLAEGGYK